LLLRSKIPPPQRCRTRLVGGVRGGDEKEKKSRKRPGFLKKIDSEEQKEKEKK
jgi:hypothetical protein